MSTIRESAINYEGHELLNIADLDKIPIDLELKEGIGKDKDGIEYKYKYTIIDNKRYRIAGTILGSLKTLLKAVPHIKHIQIIKEGEGLKTRYQVIPYTLAEE